jgi:hypothetical protein
MSRWYRICDKQVVLPGDTHGRLANVFALAALEAVGREALS